MLLPIGNIVANREQLHDVYAKQYQKEMFGSDLILENFLTWGWVYFYNEIQADMDML